MRIGDRHQYSGLAGARNKQSETLLQQQRQIKIAE
jgi:hypothetical protein